ncbi:hypothetical protein B0H15DRAFT_1006273 [Mycena belliarum]|uniref:Uncharacterized protein n=1 Tax=Mycena belliarum TaxID=1033014 RepID=A0AAD6TSL0_9AGAR|nr:hypothetical protein B0H15DRAFT_1006273 [Mycena belliae]
MSFIASDNLDDAAPLALARGTLPVGGGFGEVRTHNARTTPRRRRAARDLPRDLYDLRALRSESRPRAPALVRHSRAHAVPSTHGARSLESPGSIPALSESHERRLRRANPERARWQPANKKGSPANCCGSVALLPPHVVRCRFVRLCPARSVSAPTTTSAAFVLQRFSPHIVGATALARNAARRVHSASNAASGLPRNAAPSGMVTPVQYRSADAPRPTPPPRLSIKCRHAARLASPARHHAPAAAHATPPANPHAGMRAWLRIGTCRPLGASPRQWSASPRTCCLPLLGPDPKPHVRQKTVYCAFESAPLHTQGLPPFDE